MLEVTSNRFTTVLNVFVSPAEVFATLKGKPTILFPVLLLITSYVGIYSWYFSTVDFSWLVEQIITRMGDRPLDELDATRKAFESMSSTGMAVTNNVSIVVMLLLISSIQAGYLSLVSAITGNSFRFRHWFSLTSWTNLTGLLAVVAIAINILMSNNGQISIYDINSLSFSGLGLDAGGNTSLQALFDTLNLATIWSLGLMVAGYQHWIEPGYVKAALIVLTPHVLIYGIWAAVALV